ncbi:MAG: hypothetical protein CML16_10335 [Pusillimonas sp.]|nr:hypothetical protein [Pusillimonas sp.]HCP79800.1 hypothetical protein [Pusillimonas sp.]
MPRNVFFTYELVHASPSERKGEYVIYRTPFGLVKENNRGTLTLQRQNEWIPLENTCGQLLLVCGRDRIGLASKVVYESNWDYIQDRLKAYWWIFLLLIASAGIVSALEVSRFWISGAFVVATSAVLYREHKETGIRRAVICLLLGLVTFLAIALLIEFLYAILHGLQVIMGLCDWVECGSRHFLLRTGPDL